MWTVSRIDENDYGCEERLPGEPLLVLVTIESDDGRVCQFECADDYLISMQIEEGDEWPEDIDKIEAEEERINKMSEWIDNYFDAIEKATE